MQFGLCSAPATFSRPVSLVLRGLSLKSVIVFLDGVVILSRGFDSHIVNLSVVLRRFKQYGMKFKPKKCQLLQNLVVFLGRLVSRERVQVPPVEITRICNWGVPLCKFRRQLVVLSGVVYYQRVGQKNKLPRQSRCRGPDGFRTVAENHTGTLS